MSNWKTLAPLLIVLLIVAGLAVSLRESKDARHAAGLNSIDTLQTGDSSEEAAALPAPDPGETKIVSKAVFDGLDGTRFPVQSYRGKWLLLNFWATWCGPCRMEMPGLDDLWRKQHKAGLEMLAITDEDPQDVWKFLLHAPPDQAIHYPIAIDTGDQMHLALNMKAIPRTVLINPQGQVVADLEGARGEDEFVDALRSAGFPIK